MIKRDQYSLNIIYKTLIFFLTVPYINQCDHNMTMNTIRNSFFLIIVNIMSPINNFVHTPKTKTTFKKARLIVKLYS